MLHTGPLSLLMRFRAPEGLFLGLMFQHVCASVPLNLPSKTSAATVTVLSCSADVLAQDDKRLPENANKMIDAVCSWSCTLFPFGSAKVCTGLSVSLVAFRDLGSWSKTCRPGRWLLTSKNKKKKEQPSGSTWIMWSATEDKVQGPKGKFQWNISWSYSFFPHTIMLSILNYSVFIESLHEMWKKRKHWTSNAPSVY